MSEKIVERQKVASAGDLPPLHVSVEGCTTNNTVLIEFKRGAFYGLQSVKPVLFKYYSPYFNPAHDILDVFAHLILVGCQPYTQATVIELPVFKPNEYFFKNFQ